MITTRLQLRFSLLDSAIYAMIIADLQGIRVPSYSQARRTDQRPMYAHWRNG